MGVTGEPTTMMERARRMGLEGAEGADRPTRGHDSGALQPAEVVAELEIGRGREDVGVLAGLFGLLALLVSVLSAHRLPPIPDMRT